MAEDPLDVFESLAQCPSCATLAVEGILRCPECGHFHVNIEQRDDPSPVEIRPVAEPDRKSDPAFYSLDPKGDIPEEEFESDEDALTEWEDSTTDFAMEDD